MNSFLGNILNKPQITVKWFQVLQFNTKNSIQHQSFVCAQLND